MMSHIVIAECKTEQNFIVYHLEYSRDLIQTHNEYYFFQDMLKSNIRYRTATFLEKMLGLGWTIIGQSQNKTSIYYTLHKLFVIKDGNVKTTESLSGDELPEAMFPIEEIE